MLGHPITRSVVDAVIVCLLVAAVWQQHLIRQQAHEIDSEVNARRAASLANCEAANDSRHVLANVLIAARDQIKGSGATDAQKANAVKFYDTQINRIRFGDCSVYRTG